MKEFAVPPPATSKFVSDAIRELDALRIQRISQLVVSPEPNAVRFDFLTNVPTSPILEIFTLAQRDGILFFDSPGAQVLAVAFNFLPNPGSTDHHARLTSLPQGTECMFRITAGGGAGELAVTTGTFRTGVRDATVVVRDISMFNDGDPGLKGSGELTFDFGLYNENDDRVDKRQYRTSISSGELRKLPFGSGAAMARQRAGDWASVYVLGVEQDAAFIEAYQPPLKLPITTTAYENDDEVYVDAIQTVALPRTSGEHRVGWALHSGHHGISYIVTGWLTVVVNCPPATRYLSLGAVKSATTMNARGTRALIGAATGKRRQFAISPAGAIAINIEARRRRSPQWTIIAASNADAATVIAVDEHQCMVIAVEESTLIVRRIRYDNPASATREVLCEGVRAQLSRADSTAGAIAVAVAGDDGAARVVFVDASGDLVASCVDIGGSIAAAPALTWMDERTLVANGLTNTGGIVETRVDTEQLRSGGRADTEWIPLGGEPVTVLCSVLDDDEGPQLVGLTADRRLLARLRSENRSDWRELGSIDEVPIIENEPTSEVTAL